MIRFKKEFALLMAGVMTFGMTVTVSAATNTTSSTITGTAHFAGRFESAVSTVRLPVDLTGHMYDYYPDPNGLIRATNGAALGTGLTLPDATTDTNLYFLKDGALSNTSEEVTVANENYDNIILTVKAKAIYNDASKADVKLASGTAFGANDGDLYLALKTGTEATKFEYDSTAKNGKEIVKSIPLDGTPENFETGYDASTKRYTYTKKNGNLVAWSSVSSSIVGGCRKVTNGSLDNVEWPTISVTWSWVNGSEPIDTTKISTHAFTGTTVSTSLNLNGAVVNKVSLYDTEKTTEVADLTNRTGDVSRSTSSFSVTVRAKDSWVSKGYTNIKFEFSDNTCDWITLR